MQLPPCNMSSITEFYDIILKGLECPVCLNYYKNNIILCANGHSICEQCKSKSASCPVCRSEFGNGRNYLLEKVIYNTLFPCKHEARGCLRKRNIIEITQHKDECEYRDVLCPVHAGPRGCAWAGPFLGIKKHLIEKHNDKIIKYPNNLSPSTIYFRKFGEIFKITRTITMFKGVTWLVESLGDCNYGFCLKFTNPKMPGLVLSFNADCIPFEVHQNHKGFSIPHALITQFVSGSNGPHSFNIYKKDSTIQGI